MSLAHVLIYLTILALLALPFVVLAFLIRWALRRRVRMRNE
jgi:hypothetical protein